MRSPVWVAWRRGSATGWVRVTTNEKARTVLGWEPRPATEAVIAAAESLVGRGLV